MSWGVIYGCLSGFYMVMAACVYTITVLPTILHIGCCVTDSIKRVDECKQAGPLAVCWVAEGEACRHLLPQSALCETVWCLVEAWRHACSGAQSSSGICCQPSGTCVAKLRGPLAVTGWVARPAHALQCALRSHTGSWEDKVISPSTVWTAGMFYDLPTKDYKEVSIARYWITVFQK